MAIEVGAQDLYIRYVATPKAAEHICDKPVFDDAFA
jgi:hypothetical protein